MGFPTANIAAQSEQLPPHGVYAVRALREAARGAGRVANLGVRPTVDGSAAAPRLEVHALGFSGDLYGEHLKVEFLAFLRPEQRFADLAALKRKSPATPKPPGASTSSRPAAGC
ncbi:MAG: riboflavin kinase [Verrucomicrobiales bacterium]